MGWTYADPAGHTSEVVNCSVARTVLRIERPGGATLEVTAPVSAFEIGGRRRGQKPRSPRHSIRTDEIGSAQASEL